MSNKSRASIFNPVLPDHTEDKVNWRRLYGCSKAIAILEAAKKTEKPVVVITPDTLSASRLFEEFRFFADDDLSANIFIFPDWETLPYDLISPHQDIISERLATLATLSYLDKGILIVPVMTVLHRLIPKDFLLSHSLIVSEGQKLDIEAFKKRLVESGYSFTKQVMEHGEVAIRGSLIDIYPMGAARPVRIDLFDDDVDSIRIFDPDSQRSIDTTREIKILPAREVALIDEGIANFRAGWRARFAGNPAKNPVYSGVSQGLAPAGIEYYLPLFYQQTDSLFDYFPDNTLLVKDENIDPSAENFWQVIEQRYEQGRHDQEHPLLPPEELFFTPEDLEKRVSGFRYINIEIILPDKNPSNIEYAITLPTQLPIKVRSDDPLAILRRYLEEFSGRVLIVAETAGRRETILELLQTHGLRPAILNSWKEFLGNSEPLCLTTANLEQGVQIDDKKIAIITEYQLFGERVQQRRLRKRRQQDTEAIIRNLTELVIGAPVVHEEHGVGRYRGLVTLEIDNVPAEFICIEYANEDKLYVPVSSLDLIGRYTGADPEHAPLHKLGSDQWDKARKKAAGRIHDVAAELLEMHARRAAKPGFAFEFNENEYYSFIDSFPFEETPGQVEAIDAVINDMKSDSPMDRLICGDAGFGKTEVALRATFIAVQNCKQVAILVPTTLLAQQHFQNFRDRFADWPVRIEILSRFESAKEQKRVLEGLADGSVDVVIGTHKLIQDNVKFKRLALLIIDEEHRFGVRQKEKLKALRTDIDVLTLTATPIPRTLNMAISGLRDLSIIATPPERRLAVNTFVRGWNNVLINEALLREVKRGGQVYFLHNNIDTIDKMAREIQSLLPQVGVMVAHGQMPERELEQVMLDFYHRRFSILVCTTIIESGIDVPNANTIIINRADKFGLAQLYQLRGRVGRSHHRAYAYLIVPDRRSITAEAVKRLQAIESLETLGIGFTLATHDLEIRGAGEFLGEEQCGQIQEIGYGLYMDLLGRAVQALKAGKQPQLDRPLDHGTEVNLHIQALIPDDYLPDVHSRLILYKRIAGTQCKNELKDLEEEMIDRFGLLPQALKNLLRITLIKQAASPLGVRKIDVGEHGGYIYFHQNPRVDPGKIIYLVESSPDHYRFARQDKIRITMELPDPDERFKMLEGFLKDISLEDAA